MSQGRRMKIVVNAKACVGHARCQHVAPALFTLDDNGYVATTTFEVPEGQEAQARRAARACPEQALTVAEASAQGVSAHPQEYL